MPARTTRVADAIPSVVRDPFRTIPEAASALGVTTRTIRNYISRGDLVAYRIKGSKYIRIRQSDLDALLSPIPSAKSGGDAA